MNDKVLLSVSQFWNKGYKVIFNDNYMFLLATDAIVRRTRYLGEYDFFLRVMYQYVRDRLSLQLINIHLTLNSD